MKAVGRTILATVLGVIVAMTLLIAVECFSAIVHPLPKDSSGTMEEMCAHVANYPQWVLGVVVPAWGLTGFCATWVARRFGNAYSGMLIGACMIAAVAFNVYKLPYPLWFKITMMLVIPISVAAGYRFGKYSRGRSKQPADS